MSNWKDTTSYGLGQRGAGATSWSATSGPIKISVVKNHINNPDYWVMHCHELGMDTVNTKLPSTEPAKVAQTMAINLVRNKLKELSAAVAKLS